MTVGLWVAIFLILTLRAWTLQVTMSTPYPPGVPIYTLWQQVPPRLVTCIIGAAFSGALSFALKPFARLRLGYQLAIGVLVAMAAALLFSWVAELVFAWLTPGPRMGTLLEIVLGRAQFNVFVFMSWCFAFQAVTFSERSRENELRLLEAEALAADAQNRMLRYQINPHFLFNTLNALNTLLLERKVAPARKVVEALAEFLRYSLSRKPDEMVSLAEEVEAQRTYLAIEEVRFSDRLTFVCDIDPRCEGLRVPSLILQPLLENALKYAVSASSEAVTISLKARCEDANVVIEVTDDGPAGARQAGLGVGLENIRRRLALAYGRRAGFEHGPLHPRGFGATLVLPTEAS
jgi:signal transduction histidine kinase